MPTSNPRVHMTLEPATADLLEEIAAAEVKSVSSVARELLMEGLELREDRFFSDLADTRDTPKAKRMKHTDVWK